jgi:hypothetical protein
MVNIVHILVGVLYALFATTLALAFSTVAAHLLSQRRPKRLAP